MANQITVNSGTGNITVTTSRSVIGTVANVASANYANFAGTVIANAQPNITSVGTLTNLNVANTITTNNLVVTGNFSVGNLVANNANYANFAGIANVANTVAGANVTGTVANATYAISAGTANSATVANSANAVALANVSGAGNIASINLDGSSSNVLYGNGVFAPAAGGNTANANYANFAGTVVNASQSNITSTGNLTTFQVGTGSNDTLRFVPAGSNLTLSTGNVVVAQTRTTTATAPIDATVLSSNAGGATYTQQLFVPDGSNVATAGSVVYSADNALGAGNAAVQGSITQRVYTGGSDLTTGNVGTSLDMSLGSTGVNIIQKVPPTGVQAGSGVIQTVSYGEASNPAASVGLRFQRRRGNNNTRLSLEPNDALGNIEWRAGRGGSNYGANTAKFGAKVDSSYTANSNPVPLGLEMTVVASNGATLAHNFYANGAVNINGNISATNLGNIVSVNLDGNAGNILYGNGVFAAAAGGANANYANFAGDVVNSSQANITVLGNLVSLQVGNNAANTATSIFDPVGANITTLAGDIFVNNSRISYDDADYMANGAMAQDAIIVPFDSGNGFGETYQMNYLVKDLSDPTNVAVSMNTSYNPGIYTPGDAAASGSYIMQLYTDDSQLANANPNSTLDITLGSAGMFINRKMPNDVSAPAGTGIIGMMNYGEVSDPSSATGIVFQRRRGNNSGGTSTRDPVEANDYLGNIAWRGAGTATGSINSGRVVIGAKVDGSYGGPGNVMPIGMEMVVVDSSNTQLTHSFYANGDVSFAGNILSSAPPASSIANGNSSVTFTGSGGDVLIQTNNTQFASFGSGRKLQLTGVEADSANASQLILDNGGVQIITEDLAGGFPSFDFKSYYSTGFIAPYTFYRARGNLNAPQAVQGGDAVTTQSYIVYGDSGNTFVNIGTYSATVTNNDNAGNVQSRIEIATNRNDNGSEVKLNADVVVLQGNSAINLNATNSNVSGNLNVTGTIAYNTRTYGSFINGNDIAITANTVANLNLPTTNIANGISITSNNQITVSRAGTYNIQISLQLTNSDNASEHEFDVWFAKNGTDIASSATTYTVIKNNGKNVAALNIIDTCNANDYYQIRYAATSANISIEAFGNITTPYVRPAIPSAIVTVVPVGA